jgi:hypothetical protein
MVFGLIGGVREEIKPPPDTAKEFLHQLAQTEPRTRMLEFVLDKVQELEQSPKEITLDQVLNTTVDRFVRMQEAVGPTKSNSQSEKKKGNKSATANPISIFKDGLRILCQICGSEHSAEDCQEVHEALKQSNIRRGKFLPGPSDQGCKRQGARVDSTSHKVKYV